MFEQERLYNMIVDADNEFIRENPLALDSDRFANIANRLISAGVLMPPCRIGQMVYRVAKHNGVYRVLPR